MPLGPAAVVRFSSLGDVLLAGHVPSFLRAVDPGRRVLFVTKERFAGALRGHPDVDRFYSLKDGSTEPLEPAVLGYRGSLGDLVAAIKREGVAEIIDLHQNLRSSRIVRALEGAKRTLPSKHGLERRLMVHAKWLHPKSIAPLLTTYRALSGLAPDAPARPWLRDAFTESERARAAGRIGPTGRRGFALFGVGSAWETKRWPARHFAALADALDRDLGLQTRYAIAPWDVALQGEFRALLPPDREREILALDFRTTAAIASFAAVIVSNDSAVLHLGPAVGVPALGIFGSTVPAFGFAGQGPRDMIAEIPLSCRPCDVHGKRHCPLGHHACLERLTPEAVLTPLRTLFSGGTLE